MLITDVQNGKPVFLNKNAQEDLSGELTKIMENGGKVVSVDEYGVCTIQIIVKIHIMHLTTEKE